MLVRPSLHRDCKKTGTPEASSFCIYGKKEVAHGFVRLVAYVDM